MQFLQILFYNISSLQNRTSREKENQLSLAANPSINILIHNITQDIPLEGETCS